MSVETLIADEDYDEDLIFISAKIEKPSSEER
jgi:hypothetical protein